MKIYHFSDTHTYHNLLNPPEDIDIAIFSGDCSNPKDPYTNEHEVLNFICWYGMNFKARYKIFVAGNHDTSIEKGLVTRDKFKEYGIIYLENESVEIEGLKIWGSPFTPTFGEWAFMKARHKIGIIWDMIPKDTDIVIVHGPPKGILDLAYDRSGKLEFCGCSALRSKILKLEPKLFLSGHIHNNEDIVNAGTMKLSAYKTIFSNGSVLTDRKFNKGLSSHGNTFEL